MNYHAGIATSGAGPCIYQYFLHIPIIRLEQSALHKITHQQMVGRILLGRQIQLVEYNHKICSAITPAPPKNTVECIHIFVLHKYISD